MRKIVIILAFVFSVLAASSQKLKVNEYDKFTKQKRLQTELVALKGKLSEGISIYLRTVDSSFFVYLEGYGSGVGVIGLDEKVIFLLDDQSTVTIYSIGIQSYEVTRNGNYYEHQYRTSRSDIETLSKHKVTSIRKYSTKDYADIDIPEKNQDKVMKLVLLILSELGLPK
jgi:hypothetical protein